MNEATVISAATANAIVGFLDPFFFIAKAIIIDSIEVNDVTFGEFLKDMRAHTLRSPAGFPLVEENVPGSVDTLENLPEINYCVSSHSFPAAPCSEELRLFFFCRTFFFVC